MVPFDRCDMRCDECGQNFILVGHQIASPQSATWRRVLTEHQDDKHDGRMVSVTVTFKGDRAPETWSLND